GGPARADRHDRFHLASLTKAVTATAVARLVERGLVDWASTPGDVLPHLAESMDPTLRDVTLRQLLTHRAGVAKFTTMPHFDALPDWQGTPEQRRRSFTRWLLRRPPATPVGRYSYSNAGYTIAARMAAEVSGRPWRRLVRSQVFRPLGVRTWFGWPADRPGEPWGHWLVRGRLRPAAPDAYRFPDLVAPAGNIAVRPRGYTRFLQVHLRGLSGHDTRLLRASTIRFMHRPVGAYAMGWVRRRINGVMTSLHDGTAGTFSALAAIQPGRRLAAAMFANAGGRRGSSAVGVGLGALLAGPVSSGRSGR
ncbi:MAG: serine hydrolase domain-containing protein, partial [Nocardioidaceae bacterium]